VPAFAAELRGLTFLFAVLTAVFPVRAAFLNLALTGRMGALGSFGHREPPEHTSYAEPCPTRATPPEPPLRAFSHSRAEAIMEHTREHRSLLASVEKRLLIAIARRLPRWLSSDHLSLLGLLSMPAAGVAFALIGIAHWSAGLFALALLANWFGDSLDGTVARVRRQERPRYGFYVDHVIDLAGTAALLAGIGASGLMAPSVALAVLAAYLLVAAEAYLATHAAGVFRLSFAGIGPTELRILLTAGAFYAAGHPWVQIMGLRVRLLDISGLVAIACLVMVFVASAIRTTRALYLAEPLPGTPTSQGHALNVGRESLAIHRGGDQRQVSAS
jgi:phosphatidylglycerophosphate synthase